MKASFRALPLIALFALPAAAGDAAVAEVLPPWFDSVRVGMTTNEFLALDLGADPSVTLAPQVRAFLCRDASRTAREALGSGDLSGAREACRWGVSTARPEDAPDILEWTFLWVELLECDLGLADDASFARDLGAFRKAVSDPYWPSKMEVEQLLWKGRYDEALRRLETAPEFSNHSDPMITLAILTTSAEVHERTGAAERAEELVRAVLEQKPNHPGALCVLARLRLRAGDADGALAAAQQSLDAVGEGLFLPAGRGVLLLEKARALAAKGDTEAARALVGEVRKHLFEGVPAGTAADLAELSGKLGL